MSRIYVSLGSNINPEDNIRSGIVDLKTLFPGLVVSSVYRSKAVGFDGDDFYNLVAGFESDSSVYSIIEQLKAIELRHNRIRDNNRFASRTLDIDLLLFDDLVITSGDMKIPRDEITHYAFVLFPLSEIAGQERHPVSGITYKDLWRTFNDHTQLLHRVEFQW